MKKIEIIEQEIKKLEFEVNYHNEELCKAQYKLSVMQDQLEKLKKLETNPY